MIKYPYEIINIEKKYELPNNLVDEHNRYVELKLTDYDTMQQPERNELNDLSELLYPYNISSGDWNKFQEITANLQKFITIDMVNYINESYFSMDDVRVEIDKKIDIFKTGELTDIIKDYLKRWGGGDFMGKEATGFSKTLKKEGDIWTCTDPRGGLVRMSTRTNWGDFAYASFLIYADDVLVCSSSSGVNPSDTSDGEFIIPFLNNVKVEVTYVSNGDEDGGGGKVQLRGIKYINRDL